MAMKEENGKKSDLDFCEANKTGHKWEQIGVVLDHHVFNLIVYKCKHCNKAKREKMELVEGSR